MPHSLEPVPKSFTTPIQSRKQKAIFPLHSIPRPSVDTPPNPPQKHVRKDSPVVSQHPTGRINEVLQSLEQSVNSAFGEAREKILSIMQGRVETGRFMYNRSLQTLLATCISCVELKSNFRRWWNSLQCQDFHPSNVRWRTSPHGSSFNIFPSAIWSFLLLLLWSQNAKHREPCFWQFESSSSYWQHSRKGCMLGRRGPRRGGRRSNEYFSISDCGWKYWCNGPWNSLGDRNSCALGQKVWVMAL